MNVVCGNVFRDGLLWKGVGAGSLLFPVTIQKRSLNLADSWAQRCGRRSAPHVHRAGDAAQRDRTCVITFCATSPAADTAATTSTAVRTLPPSR